MKKIIIPIEICVEDEHEIFVKGIYKKLRQKENQVISLVNIFKEMVTDQISISNSSPSFLRGWMDILKYVKKIKVKDPYKERKEK